MKTRQPPTARARAVVIGSFALLVLFVVAWQAAVAVLGVTAAGVAGYAVYDRRRLDRMDGEQRDVEIQRRAAAKERRANTFVGVHLGPDRIEWKEGDGPLLGAHAVVEEVGNITQRLTVTRMATMGPFSLAAPKKRDLREIYLHVEGDGFAFTVPVPSQYGAAARQFAARINNNAAVLGHRT